MEKRKVFVILVSIIIFSSCGIITRTKYTSGYLLNIELLQKSYEKPKLEISKKNTIDKVSHKLAIVSKKKLKKISSSENKTHSNTEGEIIINDIPKEKYSVKPFKQEKLLTISNKSIYTIEKKDSTNTQYQPPMEPYAKWAGILFYGGLFLSFALAVLGIGVIGGLFTLAGFILAIISYKRYHQKGNPYRGEGLALSVIIAYITLLVIGLISLFLLFLAFAAFL